jgi:alpha-glucosidase (family GH31 glycosyl hydrolase)
MRSLRSLATPCLLLLALSSALGGCGGDDSIVVEGPAGRVVIDRVPFALRVEDTAGRTALALAASARTAGDVSYAPLTVSTGDEPELAYPVLSGSIDTNPASPTPPARADVRAVIDTSSDGDATVVRLSTSDPARTITLRVAPEGDGAFALRVASDGASSISATFAATSDEAFHGFGGRRESTNLRGHAIRNWVLDYRFPNVGTAYYDPAPLFYSSRGVGVLLDQDDLAVFRMASDLEDAWRVAVKRSELRLVVSPREPKGAITAITAITGRHRKPPAWSLGPTISRAVQPSKTTADYQQAITADLDRIEKDGLPVSAYCFEGWALLPEDFVASTIATLKSRGIHAVLYVRSFVGHDIAGTTPPGDYDEAIAKGYVATTKDGEPYLAPGPFADAPMAVVDFTNPAARAWWKGRIRTMLEMGADGFMNDFGEQVLSDMRFADGSTGAEMHNRYPVLQHQAAREAVDEFTAAHPEREIFFFGRAGYTGRPGSAAYENAAFPGDELNDFGTVAGLPTIIPDMLNRAVGGAWGFTTDIAGYLDSSFAPATKELYVRWSQAAALTPFFRVHNGPLTGPRMPWSYDAETEAAWQAMASLHTSFAPAFTSAWDEALATGMPVVRPLWLADEASATTPHNDDEWLVGEDVLAAPVVKEGATSREVWLPTGCWKLHGTGDQEMGPAAITVDAPLGELPWFKRCSSP